MIGQASEQSIFLHALGLASPAEQAAYLDEVCRDNAALRAELDALLAANDRLGGLSPTTGQEAAGDSAAEAPESVPGSEDAGTVVSGRYKLIEQIGEGGMGTVWMTQQTEPVKRLVALKVIKPGMDSKQVLARFEAERQALALMDHPNIARVLDGGVIDDPGEPSPVRGRVRTPDTTRPLTGLGSPRPYFVMELVKGVPITRYCDEHRLTPRDRLELFLPVCQAIQHAHQKGIIHRDIKPSNVLVARYDGKPVPKVIDFGIAKAAGQQLTDKTLVTGFGTIVGTLEYMSPEQAELNQLDIDTRSDIYSLGVLLYELLTGSTPLEKKRLREAAMLEVLRLIREEEPPRPSTRLSTTDELPSVAAKRGLEPKKLRGLVRGELDWIVMKALEKDRNRRYETANGFALDIQRFLADEAVQACPPSVWYRLGKAVRRNKGKLAVAACVFLAVMVMAASIGWAVGDRAARRAGVAVQVGDSLNMARALIAENRLTAARQKLAEARAQLGNDRSSLNDLAVQVEAAGAALDRYQDFLHLIDEAYEKDTTPVVEDALAADSLPSNATTVTIAVPFGRRPLAMARLLREALHRYEILERNDWDTILEDALLGRDQVEHIRHVAYEELLWLADDVVVRQQEHQSGGKLSPQGAARAALFYLEKAENVHRPTQALFALRARCRKVLGEQAAFQGDRQRAEDTSPTLAVDHYLRGRSAYFAKRMSEGVKAFEEALRLEPTHYWSLMRLGYCFCELGRGPEDFAGAARVFTGCIMKRPNHAHAYHCRAVAYFKLNQYLDAVSDYSQAIKLNKNFAPAWTNRGAAYRHLNQLEKAIADSSQAIELDPKLMMAWYHRGRAYREHGQLAKAVTDYSKAIELDPKFVPAWYGRGIAYADLKQQDKAVADFSQVIELDPKFVNAWYLRGNAYLVQGQNDKALPDYFKNIELQPKHAEAWNNRGLAYSRLGQPDKAFADFSQAIELDPKLVNAWWNRGNAYSELGQRNKAVADYTKAIELDPNYESAWKGRGDAYVKLGDSERAVADYSRVIELDPKCLDAWYNRGHAHLTMGRADKALADAINVIELNPKFAPAWCLRGTAYGLLGQREKAFADFSKTIELDPKQWDAWYNRGNAYLFQSELDKAIDEYSRTIELNPKFARAWNGRGTAYRRLGQSHKAIADFNRAIELDPKLTDAWYNRGLIWSNLGQCAKAVADFSRAIALNPKFTSAWMNRGSIYCDNLGQPDKAVIDFSRAIELDPKDAKAWSNRGNAYAEMGQLDKAVDDYSRAIKLDPKFTDAWHERGIAYSKLGQPAKAVADFSQVIELSPKSWDAWYSRGMAHFDLGQVEKALADYSRSIKLNPKYAPVWYERGNVYLTLGEADKAIADCSRSIELDPNLPSGWYVRAGAYIQLGRFSDAVADYQRLLKRHPADVNFLCALARLLATYKEPKLRNSGRAVELARKAVKLSPKDPKCWNTLGVALYRTDDCKAAIAALETSMKLSRGGDAFDFLFLAMAHGKLDHHDEARKWYDKALAWMKKNKEMLGKDRPILEYLRRFRSEAEEVLKQKK